MCSIFKISIIEVNENMSSHAIDAQNAIPIIVMDSVRLKELSEKLSNKDFASMSPETFAQHYQPVVNEITAIIDRLTLQRNKLYVAVESAPVLTSTVPTIKVDLVKEIVKIAETI
jgi:hypothetical protein